MCPNFCLGKILYKGPKGNALMTYEYLCCPKSDKWIYPSGVTPTSRCIQGGPGWTIGL